LFGFLEGHFLEKGEGVGWTEGCGDEYFKKVEL